MHSLGLIVSIWANREKIKIIDKKRRKATEMVEYLTYNGLTLFTPSRDRIPASPHSIFSKFLEIFSGIAGMKISCHK
jgi:hypothetical protein